MSIHVEFLISNNNMVLINVVNIFITIQYIKRYSDSLATNQVYFMAMKAIYCTNFDILDCGSPDISVLITMRMATKLCGEHVSVPLLRHKL